MPLTATREVERPEGRFVSYSQVSKDCNLAVRFHRERVKSNSLSIYLVYGSAIHRAIEMHRKGMARTADEAVRAAVSYLDREIGHPSRKYRPLVWEDPPELNKDGTISKARGNYGKLWCREIAVYWMKQQIPVWIEKYGHVRILRTEHRIFTPLRHQDGWTTPWSFESVFDLECADDVIMDLKTSGSPWDAQDVRKYSMQAHLYMGAYYKAYGRRPSFKFLVMPRVWDGELEGPARVIEEHALEFNPVLTQLYIDGVIRRKVDMIESGNFIANPTSRSCNARFCNFYHHCAFGDGHNV